MQFETAGRMTTSPGIAQTGYLPIQAKSGVWRNNTSNKVLKGYLFVGEKLGVGAYSRVERAYSEKFCCDVAVKITDELLAPYDFVDNNVRKEIMFLERLSHEYVIDIYDHFQHDDKFYTILNLAEGGNLDTYIRRKMKLQEPEARKLFRQILQAVSYCHNRAKIAHGDISCSNILLCRHGDVKLADFGMSVELKKSGGKLHTSHSGTFGYAAPEILDGRPHDPRLADIWSLGVVLFYMVTGSYPFSVSEGVEAMRSAMDRTPRWPRPLNRVSKECRDLIKSMLNVNTEERARLGDIWNSDWLKVEQERTKTRETPE
ncbi:testis-specific serine/threonine-protein kinase 3-like [Ptychodera flava]|uniref:testis-specific serine/threonine-protein kinase 3-like n=1 Tax=Ptychodera flava TaxID=63121 RepID=UPI00396A6C6B